MPFFSLSRQRNVLFSSVRCSLLYVLLELPVQVTLVTLGFEASAEFFAVDRFNGFRVAKLRNSEAAKQRGGVGGKKYFFEKQNT